jgi:hypothetical protein
VHESPFRNTIVPAFVKLAAALADAKPEHVVSSASVWPEAMSPLRPPARCIAIVLAPLPA